MVAAIAAAGMVYGSLWIGKQTGKIAGFMASFFDWNEGRKLENERAEQHVVSQMGFNVVKDEELIRDLKDETMRKHLEFHSLKFETAPHPKLQFLVGKTFYLTDEETFVLKKAVAAVVNGEKVPFDFTWFIKMSKLRMEWLGVEESKTS